MTTRPAEPQIRVHEMGIYKRYFDLIASGSKTTEIRVNDSSRKKIKTGSLIRFRCQDDEVLTRVTRITRYATFEEMLDHEELASVNPLATREEQLASIRQIYPPEREALGVLAIGIELIESAEAVSLRAAMVAELRSEDAIRSEAVAAAMAAVPRHLFAPEVDLRAAYAAHGTVEAKRGPDGLLLSVMSAPHLQAVMLEQAAIEPGMRVLEVGSGGYNAALIQELVGEHGQVTTVDIDADITDRARGCLRSAGYGRVDVILADAELGIPDRGPFDRIIVTAGSWDIPPAWISQLAAGQGRLVVPLRLRGLTRSVAFELDGQDLISRDYCLARFVPMRGDGAYDEQKIQLSDGVTMQTDDPGVRLDADALSRALSSPGREFWSGAAWDLPDELELFLTASLPGVVRLHASHEAIGQGVIAQSACSGVTAVTAGDSFAYRVSRENETTGGYESGVIAHGPQAAPLAESFISSLRHWALHHRRRGTATFRYLPGKTGPMPAPPSSIAKRHGLLAISWEAH